MYVFLRFRDFIILSNEMCLLRLIHRSPALPFNSHKGREKERKREIDVCYLTNKIPFLDVYGDINLVGHVIKSHKARRALWKI